MSLISSLAVYILAGYAIPAPASVPGRGFSFLILIIIQCCYSCLYTVRWMHCCLLYDGGVVGDVSNDYDDDEHNYMIFCIALYYECNELINSHDP